MPETKTIRWGLIGTGDVAEFKSGPALYKAARSKLHAVTNRTRAKAESFAARHGQPLVYNNAEALLADDRINAVYIATPPDSHESLTRQAAAAGKHVMCEKPMANSVEQCQRMIAACEQNGVSLGIAYYRRCFPVVHKIRELLAAGAIGRPLSIAVTTISAFASNQADPWRLDPTIAGGGFLMDVGTHRLDLMAQLFGPARRMRAAVGAQSWTASTISSDTASADSDPTAARAQVDDAVTLAMEFADGVQGSALFHWNCPVNRDSLQIVGSEGILVTDSLSGAGVLRLETEHGEQRWNLPAPKPVHLNFVQEFVDHLLEGTPNPACGQQGMLATQMALEAYADAGR